MSKNLPSSQAVSLFENVTVEVQDLAIQLHAPKGLDDLLGMVKDHVEAKHDAIADSLNPKDAKTLGPLKTISASIRSAKTVVVKIIDDELKSLKADYDSKTQNLKGNKGEFIKAMDEMAVDIRAPLTKIEEAEKAEKAVADDAIKQIEYLASIRDGMGEIYHSSTLESNRLKAIDLANGDFGKHQKAVVAAKDKAVTSLGDAIEMAKSNEEAQERAAKAEEERKASEAQAERDRIAADARLEMARQGDNQALREATASEARAQEELKQQQEAAQKEADRAAKAEADAKAAQDRADALQAQQDEANAAKEAEDAKAADAEHRKAVNRGLVGAMVKHGASQDAAISFLEAVLNNEVPNLKIVYNA